MTRREALASVTLDETTNLALWLDRYPGEISQAALGIYHRTIDRVQVPDGYTRAFEKRKAHLLAGAQGYAGGFDIGETRTFRLDLTGRAVLGIGVASVRETGLSLLRPWGVPVIPGSALKGLAARVAHVSKDQRWKRPPTSGEKAGELHRMVFGDVTEAGAVVFHDAWWIPASRMPVHADTMTVHHVDYYQGEAPPSDTDEPTPVSFLSSSGSYLVALSGAPHALNVAFALLERGLRDWGVGAKTAAGYGRGSLAKEERPTRPLTVEQQIRRTYADVGDSAEEQARWLLAKARDPLFGVGQAERKAVIRKDLARGIGYLRGGGGADELQAIERRRDALRAAKPKHEERKQLKRWQKDLEKLEKQLEMQRRAAANRAARQAKVDALLAWLDDDSNER